MALRFDLTGIKDYETVCWQGDDLDPYLKGLIFASLTVNLSTLTAENFHVWQQRERMLAVVGIRLFLNQDGKRVPLTQELAGPYFGLKTNASDLPASKFKSYIADIVLRRGYELEREDKRAAQERLQAKADEAAKRLLS